MHILLVLFMIFAVWRWADWRHWEKYHTTMLFIGFGNLMYNFIVDDHLLWQLVPKLLPNHNITELLYTLIIFPGSALLYLSNYPNGLAKVFVFNSKWIAVYMGLEWIALRFGYMAHNYNWNIWWSLLFDIAMFPLLRLHHKKPLFAYAVAFAMGLFITFYFDIPVDAPIELRK